MAAPQTGNKPRGGGMGGGSGNRRGSWRQSSGRASPAQGSGGQGQGQGQGPRSARSGSQVDQQVEGSITSVENGSGEVVSSDIVIKLQQHLGGRVLISVRGGARLQGTLSHMDNGNSPIGPTTRFCLKDAVETQRNGSADGIGGGGGQSGLVMPELYLRVGEVGSVEPGSGPSSATPRGKEDSKAGSFRTDKDIANGKPPRQRELQPWIPDESTNLQAPSGISGKRDEDTFGVVTTGWDQFATNAKLFGTKSDFDEDLYTTKLNKNGANFKQREVEAERLAREIQNAPSENPHIAEERGREIASGMDEEDRYSGVQRSTNAYVPPGARKAVQTSASPLAAKSTNVAQAPSGTTGQAAIKPATPTAAGTTAMSIPVPYVSVRPPSVSDTPERGANLPQARKTDKVETPVIRNDVAGQIREFVETERERVDKRKISMATIAKSERERKLQELKKFGKDFQVHLPFPDELLPILAKTPEKQREVQERLKASQLKEANGGQGKPAATTPTSGKKLDSPQPLSKTDMAKPSRPQVAIQIREIPPFKPRGTAAVASPAPQPPPEIPPFKPKVLPVVAPPTVTQAKPKVEEPAPATLEPPSSPPARLNPGASSFVFKPNASAPRFQPGGSPHPPPALRQPEMGPADTSKLQSPTISSVAMATSTSIASVVIPSPRPAAKQPEIKPPEGTASFFPPSMPRRLTAINVRDDFNPFRSKVPDPKTVALGWPFSGPKLGSSSTPHGMGGPSPGHEDDPGMFPNGPAGMMPPMGGVASSPIPPNYGYGPGPVRYPSHQGQPGQLQPMNMPPGQPSPYPPYATPFMGGGPMYPQGLPPGFMNGPHHPGPQNVPGGMRPGPGPPQMFYAAQSPASPHPGSPYGGHLAPPPT